MFAFCRVACVRAQREVSIGRVKLLVDANLSRRVVDRLRALGFDASHVAEIMDVRSSDSVVFATAVSNGAVLVSRDQDFSAMLASSGATRPSLINLRVSFVDAFRIAETIAVVVSGTRLDLESGAIISIDDDGYRVHKLPVE